MKLLVTGGAPQIFAEQLTKQAEQVIPSWPKELADYTNLDKLRQKAVSGVAEQLKPALSAELHAVVDFAADPKASIKAQQQELTDAATAQLSPELAAAINIAADPKAAVKAQRQQLIEQALSPVQQQQADALIALKQAEQAVITAKEQLAERHQQLLLAPTSAEAQQTYATAQQQVLAAQQAFELAKAKSKALSAEF